MSTTEAADQASQDPVAEAVEAPATDEAVVEQPDAIDSADTTDAGDTQVEPAADSEQADAAASNEWRQAYDELGFQNVETPEEAQQRLMEAYRREREQRAEAERQARYYQTVHTRLSEPQQPAAEAPQQEESSGGIIDSLASKWQELSPTAIERYITKDENGNEKFTPDAPEEFRRQVMDYAENRQQWSQVLANPKKFAEAIDQRLEAVLASRVTDTLTQREQEIADRQAEDQFFSENDWLFERDPVTGEVTDRPTKDGRMFGQFLRSAASMNIQRRSDQLRVAMAMFQAQKSQAAQAPQQARQAAETEAASQRKKMLGVKNTHPARPTAAAGVSDGPAAKPTGAKRMSLGQRVVGDLQEEGYEL